MAIELNINAAKAHLPGAVRLPDLEHLIRLLLTGDPVVLYGDGTTDDGNVCTCAPSKGRDLDAAWDLLNDPEGGG